MDSHPLHIFSGSRFIQLAKDVADNLNLPLGNAISTFLPDSEIHVIVNEVVREHDVFFIQSITRPVNEAIIELLLYIDAFRRASANKINVIIPYFPYARQERMSKGREAISARVIANLIEQQGATRVTFLDIHNPAIQGFFNIPVDPISAIPILCEYISQSDLTDSIIVSPDVGRATLAGKYAERLGLPLAIMHKRREDFSSTKVTHLVGEVTGKKPIIIDDMIAGGSILKQIDTLYDQGVTEKVWLSITHPILLDSAIDIIYNDPRIERVIVTNTLPLAERAKQCSKIEQISIAPLLSEIIRRIYHGESILNKLVLS
jgi:ribose-phosphate pyrophosphokinase